MIMTSCKSKMADTSELEEGTINEEHAISSSPRRTAGDANMNNSPQPDGCGDGEDGPSPHKIRTPRSRTTVVAGIDNQSTDTKSSGLSGDSAGLNSSICISPKHKDPDRIKKDREREERVRIARERLEEERKKKLVEIREQQKQAQENREKQLEMRRRKIEDLRRRDFERRAEVEKRRREKEDAERNRRESLLLKAEERVARYEAWKRGGQKGPPPGGVPIPTTKHLSASTSVLYHKRKSDFTSSGELSASSHQDLQLVLNTIPEGRRSFLAPSAAAPTRPKSIMTLSASSGGSAASSTTGGVTTVRLREGKSPRKPRPASVATSMPSFVSLDGSGAAASPRSKSTDRLARERSRPRTSSARRTDEKDKEKDKDDGKKTDKSGGKMSRSTLDRLSLPKQAMKAAGDSKEVASSAPVRESPAARVSPRKAFSTSNLVVSLKKPSVRDKVPKEASHKAHPSPRAAVSSASAPAAASTGISPTLTPNKSRDHSPATPSSRTPSRTPVRIVSPTPAGADEDGGCATSTPSRSVTISIVGESATPAVSASMAEKTSALDKSLIMDKSSAVSISVTSTGMEKSSVMDKSMTEKMPALDKSLTMDKSSVMDRSTGDITAEVYKAKLAEKRRQAREKAEREAEEERRKQEEIERLEEERQREEEEEERRQVEEANRQAEEARHAEEERLRIAIEAEEARRAEEVARVEQERLTKEEAEKKAREEAERMEVERQEKARKEEEERLERKKRLEMIMKRVKDNTGDSPKELSKSVTSSPTKSIASATTSSDVSPVESENKTVLTIIKAEENKEKVEELKEESPENGFVSPVTAPSPVPPLFQEEGKADKMTLVVTEETESPVMTALTVASEATESHVVSTIIKPRISTPDNNGSGDKPKFKSPLLQKLVEGKEDAGSSPGGPRFKSPLLQNILGKTKVGARMGFSQDHSMSTPDLSKYQTPGGPAGNGTRVSPLRETGIMSSSMFDMDVPCEEAVDHASHKESMNRGEDKDQDTSKHSSQHSSPGHMSKSLLANGEDSSSLTTSSASHGRDATPMDISSTMDSSVSAVRMAWSEHSAGADGTTALPASLQFSYNGHGPSRSAHGGLEDSSISMRSVESSVTSSITESAAGSVFSVGQSDSQDFEELIDLSIRNKVINAPVTTLTFLDNSDDLANFNTVGESDEGSDLPRPPIIAFEESGKVIHPDVPDLLS